MFCISLLADRVGTATSKFLAAAASAAQGGGGSFKDRKPIGDLDGCDAWMAERHYCCIDKWLDCRAAHLSIYPCL